MTEATVLRRVRVAVTSDLAEIPAAVEALRELDKHAWIEWEFVDPQNGELVLEHGRYDAALVFAARVTARTLEARIRLVARLGVGLDNVDLEACRERGVAVTITPDAVRRPTASGAVAMLLALTHQLLVKDRLVRTGDWNRRHQHVGTSLEGKMAGFLGFGNIGREIAKLIAPWDMRVVAHTRSGVTDEAVGEIDFAPLGELLRLADVLFIACPLTPQTRGLLGERELALLKNSAYLINIARGPIVNEDALIAALLAGRIAGAGLDVFDREPLPVGHPFTQMENVVLAPHSVGHLQSFFTKSVATTVDALRAVRSGMTPEHIVRDVWL